MEGAWERRATFAAEDVAEERTMLRKNVVPRAVTGRALKSDVIHGKQKP